MFQVFLLENNFATQNDTDIRYEHIKWNWTWVYAIHWLNNNRKTKQNEHDFNFVPWKLLRLNHSYNWLRPDLSLSLSIHTILYPLVRSLQFLYPLFRPLFESHFKVKETMIFRCTFSLNPNITKGKWHTHTHNVNCEQILRYAWKWKSLFQLLMLQFILWMCVRGKKRDDIL